MLENILDMSIEEIKNGYSHDSLAGRYICNICGKEFEDGEIFESGSRFFDAFKMIKTHVLEEHGSMLDVLSSYGKKYTGITENQKELLGMFSSGMPDGEIAKANGVAASTIRHQRFVFRERARQAKLYLAIYELAIRGGESAKSKPINSNEIIDIHSGAKMIDDRYIITKAEEEKVLSNLFYALSPLRLKTFPAKEKSKIIVLRRIAAQFEPGRIYTEKEVNDMIQQIYADFATIRRYLIEYGFMDRTIDCREYRIK